MRKPFIAGNWKMNTDSHSSVALAKAIVSGSTQLAVKELKYFFVPRLFISRRRAGCQFITCCRRRSGYVLRTERGIYR